MTSELDVDRDVAELRRFAETVAREFERLNVNEEWRPAANIGELIAVHRGHLGSVIVNEPADLVLLECTSSKHDRGDEQGLVQVIGEKIRVACCDGHRTGLAHSGTCSAPPSGRQRSGHYLAHHSSSCPTCSGIADAMLKQSSEQIQAFVSRNGIELETLRPGRSPAEIRRELRR